MDKKSLRGVAAVIYGFSVAFILCVFGTLIAPAEVNLGITGIFTLLVGATWFAGRLVDAYADEKFRDTLDD
jgi:hypothetical protein